MSNSSNASNLLYPGDDLFDYYSVTLPLKWRECIKAEPTPFVAEPGSGMLRPVNAAEFKEYVLGGEYDERLEEIDNLEDAEDYCEDLTQWHGIA
jgi:hypothetical protein